MSEGTLSRLMEAAPGGNFGQPAGTVDPDLFRAIAERLGTANSSGAAAAIAVARGTNNEQRNIGALKP